MKVPVPEGSVIRDWAILYVRVRQLIREIGKALVDWSR